MNRALDLMTHDELERLPRDADGCFGSLATARGHLPLEAMDVHARAVGLDVRVELRQTFVNNLAQPIEATYIFPLPDRAAVNRFRLRVGERVIEGVIDERGQARQNYEEAIRAGHRAAIAEEERPDVFTVRVGNLMPGQRAEVQIDIVGALAVERNEATFRFPLVVAPRYIPGQPLSGESVGAGVASDTDAVPDASRITPPVLLPGYPNPVRLSLRVDVDPAGLPISRLRSSLHAVTDIPGEGGRRRIELVRAERLDRDFVLRYALGDGAVRTSLLLARDADGQMDSFALTLLPPEQGAPGERPRDVVLVLDRSGSMGGWKMVAARRAAARIVDSLSEQDRFAVLAFDDHIDAPAALPADALSVAADRNRFRAVEFLAGLEARGGTEMAAPLLRAAELLGGGYRDRERIMVLVTDGQIGNEDQILRELAPRLRGARVFALGVDRAVNEGFLRRLADLGGGGAELVESEDRLDEVMDRVHRRIGTPVVTEISLEGDGLEIEPGSISPRRLPDLLAGAPVVIRGRARGKGGGAIVLRGVDRAGQPWQERVSGQTGGGGECAALWARAMIRDLEDRYAIGDSDTAGLARRIVDLSIRFSVLSRFTAFLAVDRSEKVNPGGKQHRSVQPVEPASGWDMLGTDEEMAALPAFDRMYGGPPVAEAPAPAPMLGRAMSTKSASGGGGFARPPMAGGFAPAGGPPPPGAPRPGPAKTARPRFERKKERGPSIGQRLRDVLLPQDEKSAPASKPAPSQDLVARLRELAERLSQRASVHAAVMADLVARELDALAGELGGGRGDVFARLDRARHALRLLLGSGAAAAELEAILAEAAAALALVIAELETAGGGGGRRRDFWK